MNHVPFFKDNHTANSVNFTLSAQPVSDWLKPVFLNFYSVLDKKADLYEISGANINSENFKLGNFYLKLIKHNNDKDYVLQFPLLAAELQANDIPVFNYIKNKHNELITNYLDPKNQQNYYIYCQEFQENSFYSGQNEEFQQALNLLKKLKSIELKSTSTKFNSPYLNWNPDKIIKDLENVSSHCGQSTEFERFSALNFSRVKTIISEHADLINNLKTKSNYLNHYDLHPHNLFFHDLKLCSVLDLESFIPIQFEICEAFAIFKLARKSVSTGQATPKKIQEILLKNQILPNRLFPYIKLELARRALLVLSLHYIEKNELWDNDIYKQIVGFTEAEQLFIPKPSDHSSHL